MSNVKKPKGSRKLDELRRMLRSGEMRFEMAPQSAVTELSTYVDRVVAILEELLEAKGSLVSDESLVSASSAAWSATAMRVSENSPQPTRRSVEDSASSWTARTRTTGSSCASPTR